MTTFAALVLLVVGVAWPLSWLVWLNARLNREPPLSPRQLGLLLALNFIFPVSLILTAFGMLLDPLGASVVFRVVLVTAWTAVAILALGVWWARKGVRSGNSRG